MTEIYPRLSPAGVLVRAHELEWHNLEELEGLAVASHPMETRGASGGMRIGEDRLLDLSDKIFHVARKYGYPAPIRSRSDFDADLGELLALKWQVPLADALHQDTWSFLCLCLVPHIVAWRFSVPSKTVLAEEKHHLNHFAGGNRNALQRTWIRAYKLGAPDADDPVWLVRELLEDTLVGIFERPALSSNRHVALQIARMAFEAQKQFNVDNLERFHREALKLVRARAAVRYLGALPSHELRELLQKCWFDVALALQEESVEPSPA
ncbi:hypothetical protein FRC96_07920 [Lujinxingia vulgaris]|uniref:Uncharacterized protein n=1 Tax=Lujinxingia vulgaris TaxID=2600176 RepID=A0A5C6XK03_9DELT|nr:DUF6339 family protein [Lujinxingia vulgaris]TXD37961.1 hypothetical protein FRC96_07920 [Lujinxingia vulgaris]